MRHESHRVKQKNYRDFNGKPLFHWIILSLLKCPSIATICINTDSPTIKEQVGVFGSRVVVIDRPAGLLGDQVPMNDILKYDVTQIDADVYVQTHSTNPLLKAETIEEAIKKFLASTPIHDSLFTVTRWQARFWDNQGKAINHDPNRLERTQNLVPIFEENSSLYIFSKDVLLKRGNRIGYKPMMHEIPKLEAVDIDNPEDFEIAAYLHQMMLKK